MSVRIDKYLWEVRLFKTRALATEACRRGKVFVANKSVKPSFLLSVGNEIGIKKGPVLFSYKVLSVPTGRVGAKLVGLYISDITSREQLELLNIINQNCGFREKGSGRPTKKERRELTDFIEDSYMYDDFLVEDI